MPSAYLTTNLVTSSTTITSSSEDANWPHENLYDEIAAKVFRWTSAAAGSSIEILGDNANPPVTSLATPSLRTGEIWADLGSSVNARYVRLTVDAHWVQFDFGSSQTPDTFVIVNHNWGSADDGMIGQIVIGTRVELPRAYWWDHLPGKQRDEIYKETQGGVPFVAHLYTRLHREYFWRVLGSEYTTFTTFDSAIRGRLNPYVFIPNTDEAEVLYVRNLEGDWMPRLHRRPTIESGSLVSIYDIQLRMRQESYGLDLAST